jgi:antitoxin component YwqK of YwqJK toxin-antitoxin module
MKTAVPLFLFWLAFGSLIHASELPQEWILKPSLLFSADGKWLTQDGAPYTGVMKIELHDVDRKTSAPIGDPRFTKIFRIQAGMEEGEAAFLNSEGKVVQSTFYKDGKKDGPEEIITPSFGSATCRTQYRRGLMDGRSEGFSETGEVEWMVLFRNGIPASFRYEGDVVLVGQENVRRRHDGLLYVADSPTPFAGVIVEFYINGRLKSFSEYKAGLQEGVGALWHPSAAIYVYHEYRRGKMHGASLKWNGFNETRDLDSFHFLLDGKLTIGHAPHQMKADNENEP